MVREEGGGEWRRFEGDMDMDEEGLAEGGEGDGGMGIKATDLVTLRREEAPFFWCGDAEEETKAAVHNLLCRFRLLGCLYSELHLGQWILFDLR